MEQLLTSVVGWARDPHSHFLATPPQAMLNEAPNWMSPPQWCQAALPAGLQDPLLPRKNKLISAPQRRQSWWPKLRSNLLPNQHLPQPAWHWEDVQVKRLRPAWKREARAVPNVFPLACALQVPSPGTAVGRGQQKTPVAMGQGPLVGLEQSAAWGQNDTHQLSSCKPIDYFHVPKKKPNPHTHKKKNHTQKIPNPKTPKQTQKKSDKWLEKELGHNSGWAEQAASGHDCTPVTSGWRARWLGKPLSVCISYTAISFLWVLNYNFKHWQHTHRVGKNYFAIVCRQLCCSEGMYKLNVNLSSGII